MIKYYLKDIQRICHSNRKWLEIMYPWIRYWTDNISVRVIFFDGSIKQVLTKLLPCYHKRNYKISFCIIKFNYWILKSMAEVFIVFSNSWLLSWWNNITLQYAKWSFSIMQMSYFVSQPFHSPTNFSWVPTGRTKGFKHIVRRPRPSIHFLFRGKPYRVGMMIFNDNVSLEEKCCLYLRVFYVCKIR